MPETRRRMRIGPNARRGGNIDDRRGEDRRFQVLARDGDMYVTPRQGLRAGTTATMGRR
jgi:hypothetical protein